MKKLNVAIIGLGYVGFPLLCVIARNKKYHAIGFDLSAEKILQAEKYESTVEDELAKKLVKEVTYEVSNNPEVLKNTDIFIICVPTPVDESYNPDYEPVLSAVSIIAPFIRKNTYIVLESTVNPGTCEEVVLPILERLTNLKGGKDFELAHCPERINPGDLKWNVLNIPRNIGALTTEGTKYLADFYRSVLDSNVNEMKSIKEAEATKIIENTFRDINIAYVNELAKSFDVLGIDLINVIKGASNKPFAFMPHYPSCGVGGHCIPVDPYYLIERAKKAGFDHVLLKNARNVNNSMPEYTVEKLMKALNEYSLSIKGAKIVLLGLSYKKNMCDLRESPALVIRKLLETVYHCKLRVYDPYNLQLSTHQTLEDAIKDVDAVIIATAHDEFTKLPIEKWKNVKVLIDGQNCLNKELIQKLGVTYKGIGR